jgi:hypothetical protein
MGEPNKSEPELLISVDQSSTVNTASGLCCMWDPAGTAPDAGAPELADAEALDLPASDPNAAWTLHGMIDAYGDIFGLEELSKVLFLVAKEGGGMGYTIERADFAFESYEVDHAEKKIFIDVDEVFGTRTNQEAAEALREAIFREVENGKTFWDHAFRVAKGAGITVLGAGEMFVGVVGIIAPVPGTTVAGVIVTAFGAATVTEGVTQMFNLNEGEGLNPLEEGFAAVGSAVGDQSGEQMARVAFAVTNLVVSVGGSYKLLKVPGAKFVMKGTINASGKYYREGLTLGRLQLAYPMEGGGHVIVNVVNNSRQWVFRFQSVGGQIVLNGRIVGTAAKHRVSSPLEMVKVLVKLALHGAKAGL